MTDAGLTEQSTPGLSPGVTMRFDKTRERWVILAPERVLMPDEIAVEVLKRCQGQTIAAIIDDLQQAFGAPRDEIAGDVLAMLQDLHDKGVIGT